MQIVLKKMIFKNTKAARATNGQNLRAWLPTEKVYVGRTESVSF